MNFLPLQKTTIKRAMAESNVTLQVGIFSSDIDLHTPLPFLFPLFLEITRTKERESERERKRESEREWKRKREQVVTRLWFLSFTLELFGKFKAELPQCNEIT